MGTLEGKMLVVAEAEDGVRPWRNKNLKSDASKHGRGADQILPCPLIHPSKKEKFNCRRNKLFVANEISELPQLRQHDLFC